MLTRLFLIAVFWWAVFRFIGRILRFLAGPPAAPATSARSGGPSSPGSSQAGGSSAHSAPPRAVGEVIDVPFVEVPPRRGE